MIRNLLSRLGCLLFLVGGILLALGVAAERSDQPAFNFIVIGLGLGLVGFLLWNKLRRKRRRNIRFSLFRKRRSRDERMEDDQWDDPYYD